MKLKYESNKRIKEGAKDEDMTEIIPRWLSKNSRTCMLHYFVVKVITLAVWAIELSSILSDVIGITFS
jgi:hypothetical protein